MKTAVIFASGVKQIVLTPESKDEEFALSLITLNDDIELLMKNGHFGEKRHKPFTASVNLCQDGFLRIFDDSKSKILVLKPKAKNDNQV